MSIDRLASVLAAKLKESKDHQPLDQVVKTLRKYASTPSYIHSATTNNMSTGHWKKKTRKSRLCTNEDLLSDWLITATMRENLFPLVKQLKTHLIYSM